MVLQEDTDNGLICLQPASLFGSPFTQCCEFPELCKQAIEA